MAGVTVAFDTLKAATRLQEEAGFDQTKARVLVSTFAEGLVENLATKDDIAGLRHEFTTLRREITTLATKEDLATLRGEMKQMHSGLHGEITDSRGEMKQRYTDLDAKMHQIDANLRGEMKQMHSDLHGEITDLRGEMKQRYTDLDAKMHQIDANLRGEMKQADANLSSKISKVQERLTVRLGGAVAAAVAILVAVDKLL